MHAQRRVRRRRLRGVAVLQVQRHALVLRQVQVRRQAQRDCDVTGVVAGDVERLRVAQFGQLDRPVRPQPVGRVVGPACHQHRRLGDRHAGTRQGLAGCGQGGRSELQLCAVAALHQQQPAVGVVRVGDDRQRRAGRSRQLQTGGRAFGTDQHDRMSLGRQCVEGGWEVQHPALGAQAEPGCQRAGGFQRGVVRRAQKHHWQAQLAAVAGIEEGFGQQRQVVGLGRSVSDQLELAQVADGGPQAAVLGVLAARAVVADQLQRELVVLGDQLRRQFDDLGHRTAGTRLGQRQTGGHLAIDQHVDLGELAQQIGRIGIAQLERRLGDHLVSAHAERDAEAGVGTPQAESLVAAQLLEAQPVVAGRRLPGIDRQSQGRQHRRGSAERAERAGGTGRCGRRRGRNRSRTRSRSRHSLSLGLRRSALRLAGGLFVGLGQQRCAAAQQPSSHHGQQAVSARAQPAKGFGSQIHDLSRRRLAAAGGIPAAGLDSLQRGLSASAAARRRALPASRTACPGSGAAGCPAPG